MGVEPARQYATRASALHGQTAPATGLPAERRRAARGHRNPALLRPAASLAWPTKLALALHGKSCPRPTPETLLQALIEASAAISVAWRLEWRKRGKAGEGYGRSRTRPRLLWPHNSTPLPQLGPPAGRRLQGKREESERADRGGSETGSAKRAVPLAATQLVANPGHMSCASL